MADKVKTTIKTTSSSLSENDYYVEYNAELYQKNDTDHKNPEVADLR